MYKSIGKLLSSSECKCTIVSGAKTQLTALLERSHRSVAWELQANNKSTAQHKHIVYANNSTYRKQFIALLDVK